MTTSFPHFYKKFSHKTKREAFREVSTPYLLSHVVLFLKKILCAILIIQLAFPPCVLMAMEREDALNPPPSSGLRSRKEIPQTILPLTTKLKTLYRNQNKLPKLIEDASVPEQSMDDYYVKLQIVLNSTTAAEEKYPIHLFQMFEKVEDEEAAGKVLVVGVAGIGKTTFFNHITHEWGQGKVFSGTFDTIFKIRLRSLLDDGLIQELSTEYTPEDRLAALIQRSIEQQQQELKTSRGASGSFDTAAVVDSEESIGSDVSAFSSVSLEEIKTVDRTRTVLLLDGYDEIEHLNRGGHVVSDLMRRIFEYPYVVLTSRPNAVTSVLENRFERKIEALGLGNEGVPQYMDRYFYKQSESLIRAVEQGLKMMPPSRTGNVNFPLFQYYERQGDIYSKGLLSILEAIDIYAEEKGGRGLGETPQEMRQTIEDYYKSIQLSLFLLYKDNALLRETLTTPINLAMVCLLATDPAILRRFVGEFNAGQLYEGVVVWLGKRYLTKFKEKEAKDTLDTIDIVDERILHLEELSILEQAAYQEFKVNKTNIPGKKIDALARTTNPRLGIRQVNKYGLIKPDVSKPLYDLDIYLYGAPEDQDIKASKLCFYLDPDKKSLAYAVRRRGGIERVDLTAVDGLSNDFKESIVASLSKRERELKARDKKALFSFLSSKGYEISEESSSAKGVSREVLEAQDLIHRDHRFIHLSFQEYLTAHSLKELLQQEDPQVVRETAQFIGEHRNEPRYLMTLKFLAGIVSKEHNDPEDLEEAATPFLPSKARILVTRFWDAVTCNVDGVLEFNLGAKINLLMHLLGQGKRDGIFDSLNPHLPKLTTLIDEVVLQDIVSWEETIIRSGYLSPTIVAQCNALLSNPQEANTQKLKTAIEVITSLVNRREFGGREAVFKELLQIVRQVENWQIKKLGLQKLGQVMDQSISKAFLEDCLETITPLLEDSVFANNVSNLLPKIIKMAPHLAGTIFSLLEFPLKDSEFEVRQVAAWRLGQVVKAAPDLAPQVFSFLDPLLKASEERFRRTAAESLGEMVTAAPKMASQALVLLGSLLEDSELGVVSTAAESLGQVVKADPEVADKAFPLLESLLKGSNEDATAAAVWSLGEVVTVRPKLASQAFPILVTLLKDPNTESQEEAARSLAKVVKADPEVIPQVLLLLESFLKDSDRYVRAVAASSLEELVEASPSLAPHVFSLLETFLKDSNLDVRRSVAGILGNVLNEVPSLAPHVFSLLKPLLEDSEGGVKVVTAWSLGQVGNAAPEEAHKAFPLLKTLLGDPEESVRAAAASSLQEVVRTAPSLAHEALPLLKLSLEDSEKDVKRTAVKSLGEVVRVAPSLAPDVFSLLEPLLEDSERGVREAAAESLGKVAAAFPDMAPQAFFLLKILLEDPEESVREAAASSLQEVVGAAPSLAHEALPLLKLSLEDSEKDVKRTAVKSLGEVVRVAPSLAPDVFSLLEPLLEDSERGVREAAAESLGKVAAAFPDMAPQAFFLLKILLEDPEESVREAAAESLGEIAICVPPALQDVIICFLDFYDFFSVEIFDKYPLTTLAHFLSKKLQTPSRSELEESLLSKLKSANRESLTHEQIPPLLTIVDLTKSIDDTKDINLTAQKVLKKMAREVDDAGIAWINAHFAELPNVPERQVFLKDVYHTLLKRGHINETGRDFIIHCIQSGLTTSITRSGTLIHEGVTYTLSPESKQYLSAITEAALQQDDRLAEQYRIYQPLFSNNKVGLRMAASDIAPVSSLAGSYSLSGGCWRLTLLTSDTSSSPFILLEKRNRFGDHIAQKFNTLGQALSPRYVCHPEQTTRVFREGLFGAHTLSIYTAQSILLSEDKKRELFFEGSAGSAPIIDPQLGAPETWEGFKTRLFEQTAKRYSLTQGDLLGIDPTSAESQLMRQEKALQDGGVYDLAAIRRGFHALETLPPQLKNYCKTFYWTMANYFEAYRSISTGLFQTNTGAEITTKEQIGVKFAKKGAQYIAEVLKPVPVLGSAVALLDTLIDDIMGMVEQTRFENKVNAIMRIIRKKCHPAHDISSTIAKVALEGTTVKTQAILHPAPKVTDASMMGNFDRLKSTFEEKFAALKNAILPTIELNDPADPGVQLALKDVTLTMAYLFKNHEEIIRNKEPLDIQMIEIIRNGSLERLLSTPSSLPPVSKSSQQTTAVAPTAVNNNSQKGSTPASQSGKKTTCVTS